MLSNFTGFSNWKVSDNAHERLLTTLQRGQYSVYTVLQLLYPQTATIVAQRFSVRSKENQALLALKESTY